MLARAISSFIDEKLYYRPPRLLAKIYANVMVSVIMRKRPQYDDIAGAVKFAYNYRNPLSVAFYFMPIKPEFAPFTIVPAQIPYEILTLLALLRKLRPKKILEIGTERGGTLFLFTYVADEHATLVSIDLPPSGFRFGFSYPYWKENVYRNFRFHSHKIHVLRGDSHSSSTFKEVARLLGDEKLDFLFIDGDHTYEGVRKDFEMYSPLVREGGIIAFHDIVPDYFTRYGIRTGSATGGVPRFWQEIKRNYKHQEIVQDYNQDGYGIGVIYWECERS